MLTTHRAQVALARMEQCLAETRRNIVAKLERVERKAARQDCIIEAMRREYHINSPRPFSPL